MGIREYALIVCYLLICAIIVALCYLFSLAIWEIGVYLYRRIEKRIRRKEKKGEKHAQGEVLQAAEPHAEVANKDRKCHE